jgi:hypothetical protein
MMHSEDALEDAGLPEDTDVDTDIDTGIDTDELEDQEPAVLPVVFVDDATFDAALAAWVFVDEVLVPSKSISRKLKDKEVIDRYAFTAFVEALRADEFEDDPFATLADLELPVDYDDEDEAWQAICDFYASRACVLLRVGASEAGHCDEFIVGEELASHFGFLNS